MNNTIILTTIWFMQHFSNSTWQRVLQWQQNKTGKNNLLRNILTWATSGNDSLWSSFGPKKMHVILKLPKYVPNQILAHVVNGEHGPNISKQGLVDMRYCCGLLVAQTVHVSSSCNVWWCGVWAKSGPKQFSDMGLRVQLLDEIRSDLEDSTHPT